VDRVGLVGLPNSGKSSLFNSLTGGDAVVASHPFSTVETEVGVAHVPDPRVDALGRMSQSRKIVYAGFEVVDIAAIAKGGEKGDALGGRFLAGVREVDALCLVLRSFEDENVPGDTDPLAALESSSSSSPWPTWRLSNSSSPRSAAVSPHSIRRSRPG